MDRAIDQQEAFVFWATLFRGSQWIARSNVDIVHPSATLLSRTSGKMTLEAQLIQAHVKLQLATRCKDGSRIATVLRHDEYEVRLIELSQASAASTFLFWLELFDHNRQVSVDSAGSQTLEDAVISASHLIALAMSHDENPHQA
jgi:hypothetical protein